MESFASKATVQLTCPNGHGAYSVNGERTAGQTFAEDTGCPYCGALCDDEVTPDAVSNRMLLEQWAVDNTPVCGACGADRFPNDLPAVRMLQQYLWEDEPDNPMWLCLACGNLLRRDGSTAYLPALLWTTPVGQRNDEVRDRSIAMQVYTGLVLETVPLVSYNALMLWGIEQRVRGICGQVTACLDAQGIPYMTGSEVPSDQNTQHGGDHRGWSLVIGQRVASFGIPGQCDWRDFEDATSCVFAGPEPEVLLGEAVRVLNARLDMTEVHRREAVIAQRYPGESRYNEGYYAGVAQGLSDALSYIEGIAIQYKQNTVPLCPTDLIRRDPRAGAIEGGAT